MSTVRETDVFAMFREEAAERLTTLGDLLLELHPGDADAELVNALFREAHTVKGAAEMLGIEDVATEAHAMEEVLHQVRSGAQPVTGNVVDGLFRSLDRLLAMTGGDVFSRPASDASPAAPPTVDLTSAATATDPEAGAEADAPTAGPPSAAVAGALLSALLDDGLPDAPADHPEPAVESVVVVATPPPPSAPPAQTAQPAQPALALAALADLSSGPQQDRTDERTAWEGARKARRETARVGVDRLDELVRLAGEATAAQQRLAQLVRDSLDMDPYAVPEMRALTRLLTELQDRTLRARMLPVGSLSGGLRRAARELARRTGKEVRCEVRGEDTELDRTVHEVVSDALVHLVRNAIDHGIEPAAARRAAGKESEGVVLVHAMQLGSRVIVTVSDDGAGVDVAAVRAKAERLGIDTAGLDDAGIHDLLFRPGFSTAAEVTNVSGRGVGLDAVRESLEALRGRIEVESTPGSGTRFRISVPITLTVVQALIVQVAGRRYALAMQNVVTVLGPQARPSMVEGRPTVRVAGSVVPVHDSAELLGVGHDRSAAGRPVVVLTSLARTRGLAVDTVVGQREVLVKAVPSVVPPLPHVVGASAEADGSVMLILDAEALVDAASATDDLLPFLNAPDLATDAAAAPSEAKVAKGRILVVDDAMAVRELQRTILSRAGYDVRTAVDGQDALTKLVEADGDLVLTDLEMPRMDGLELTRAIRNHSRFANLPVVVLTSRGGDEDRKRGMDAGADAYIVKSSFSEASLLSVVEGLLGRRA